MLIRTPLAEQIAAQREDRLRVLIVGAGVAGLTLAAMLRRDGLHPVLIDRMPDDDHPGYMLALMPLVDRAFADLGLRERYRAASIPLNRYAFRSHTGVPLRCDSLRELLSDYGDYNGISRGALVSVLSDGGIPVTFQTTVSRVDHGRAIFRTVPDADSTDEAEAADEAAFDLIVGADGIRSGMRRVLAAAPEKSARTGWSGWVVWCDERGDADLVEELWGDGFFLGAYPVKDALGVFLGGPNEALRAGTAAFAGMVRSRVGDLGPRLDAALDAVASADEPYLWSLDDARVSRWVLPGGALIGDAAAGFLPTAGIGAGMAMESAWMLGRMLTHADRSTMRTVLAAWEKVQRPRVESAQTNSRLLAKLMFRRGKISAWLRESVMRVMSVRAALGPILRLVADRPDPDAVARAALAPSPTPPPAADTPS